MNLVHYRTGYLHQLAQDHEQNVASAGILPVAPGGNQFVQLTIDGLLIIRAGYAWDGASGPAINTRSFVRPSLVHDALYQLIRLGVVDSAHRSNADKLLAQMLREDTLIIANRQPWATRWPLKALAVVRPVWVEAAVRLGGRAYMHMHSDEVLTAP